ncbi:unnamed protein product [Rotaria socialis]|uniref:Uncharacterized protein n=1 Tax=Rotaria socialis TaxID=392032 RepID=A0A820PBM2_9BILA|nr:unnamed protein product [Rotaria socialis]
MTNTNNNRVVPTQSMTKEAWTTASPRPQRRSIIREFAVYTSTDGLPGIARSQIAFCNYSPARFDRLAGPFLNYLNSINATNTKDTETLTREQATLLRDYLQYRLNTDQSVAEYFLSLDTMLIEYFYNDQALDVSAGMVVMIHDNTQLHLIDISGILLAHGRKHKLRYKKKVFHGYLCSSLTTSSAVAPSTRYASSTKAYLESMSVPLSADWSTNWLSEIQNNYVALNVVFESTQVENYTQEASVGPVNVLFTVGDHSELWIGISFLSIMDVFEMLYRLCRYAYHSLKEILRHRYNQIN